MTRSLALYSEAPPQTENLGSVYVRIFVAVMTKHLTINTELFHVSIFKLYCFSKIMIDFFQNILTLFPTPLYKQRKTWGKMAG